MSGDATPAVLAFAEGYAAVGLAISALFLLVGIDRVDTNARGAWAFRPLLIPGVVLLWPLVLWRWAMGPPDTVRDPAVANRPPLSAQRSLALTLALVVPALILLALVLRRDGPLERPPILLHPPGSERPS